MPEEAKSMSFTEKATLVGVSVGISALLAWGISSKISEGIRGNSDDAPIIIGGGSLYFGTGAVGRFTKSSAEKLEYTVDYKVSDIDWVDSDGVPGSANVPNMKGTIAVMFCQNAQCNGPNVDTVTLTFDPANSISLTNTLKSVGNSQKLLPTLWRHPKKNWIVKQMDIAIEGGSTTTVKCDDSACGVVVHACIDGKLCK